MTVEYSCANFTSYIRVLFKFDNGVELYQCEADAERIEQNGRYFIIFTTDGEEVNYPAEQISDINMQTMIRADYHQPVPNITQTPIQIKQSQ